eukprot:1310551-Rhodomonas_salina.1
MMRDRSQSCPLSLPPFPSTHMASACHTHLSIPSIARSLARARARIRVFHRICISLARSIGLSLVRSCVHTSSGCLIVCLSLSRVAHASIHQAHHKHASLSLMRVCIRLVHRGQLLLVRVRRARQNRLHHRHLLGPHGTNP